MNPFDYFDLIYCINLDSRPDRWEDAKKEFSKVGILDRVKRIRGVVHENPAHGCHLSHEKCFYLAEGLNKGNVLIFEDDVEFFPDAVANLEQSIIELPWDWEMFYLGANLDRYPAYYVNDHIARLTGAFSTHAYAVKYNLFPLMRSINSSIETVHNDVSYAEFVHSRHNCYLAMPLVAGQRKSYSDIQKCVMDSNPMFQDRLRRNLVR